MYTTSWGVVSWVITVPTNSPSLRTEIFSAISKTSINRWEMKIIAIPRALSFLIRPVRIFTSVEVRDAVGSSIMRTLESKEMAFAISTICCSATERELHRVTGLMT